MASLRNAVSFEPRTCYLLCSKLSRVIVLCVVAAAAAMTVAAIAGMNFNFDTYCQPGAYLTHTSERILRSNTEKKYHPYKILQKKKTGP